MRRAKILGATLLAGCCIAAVLTPAAHAAPASFLFKGSGWGHRVGLPQYGALEQAKDGKSWRSILGYYYKGTGIGTNDVPATVRVLLSGSIPQVTVAGGSRFSFTSGGNEVAASGGNDGRWTVRVQPAGNFTIVRPNGLPATAPVTASRPLKINYDPWSTVISVNETGRRYRWGKLELTATGSTIRTILDIPFERYVRGIAEVPASWPVEALRAQAVAARTYAADKARRAGHHRSGCDCTLFSDTRDQVYRGYEKEDPAISANARWVKAVDDTAGQVVTYGGHPIQAYFHSSSGGRTEASADVWSTDLPYLKPVDDPWSLRSSNPYARWEAKLSQEDVAKRLGMRRVDAIAVKSKTAGGGVREVLVSGSPSKTIRGSELRSKLGLRSTMFAAAGSQEAFWSRWQRIQPNDRAAGSPSLASSSSGALHALVVSPSGVPYASRRDPGSGLWSGWTRVGNLSGASEPRITVTPSGAAQALVRGSGGEIWTSRLDPGGSWSPWFRIGSASARGREPAISAGPDGVVWAAIRGLNAADVYASRRDPNGGWSGWTRIGSDGNDPAIAGTQSGAIVAVRGGNNAIKYASYGGSWSAFRSVGNGFGRSPALTSRGSKTLLAVRGRTSDRLYAAILSGGAWSPWSELSSAQVASGAAPSVVIDSKGRSHVFARGAGDIILTATKGSGAWAGLFQVGDNGDRAASGTVIAPASAPGRLYVLIRGPSAGLFSSYRSIS